MIASVEHVDVIVVGAGLSGLCAAYHLDRSCPWKSMTVLEGREALGGTWDLFRYPGVRSDSDMQTLGYTFSPWTSDKAIADGPSILNYMHDTAREFDLKRHIRFSNRVVAAAWSTPDALWRLTVETPDGERRMTCNFLSLCCGYYDYEGGHRPAFPGEEAFAGPIVHPQQWPEDLDYAGRNVVVIGSGATAATLVPEMAKTAARVVMLQRTPSWMAALPAMDPKANWLRRRFGAKAGHALARWKNIAFTTLSYQMAQRFPNFVGGQLNKIAAKMLPPGYDIERHLMAPYKPWDQRVCLVPDGDLFKAIASNKAEIVTDRIERFDEAGIRLQSGKRIDADIVIAATGLKVKLAGGIDMRVDGEPVRLGETYSYKGALYCGVPNCSVAIGYTNNSWTLKSELIARYVVRLLNHMEVEGYDYAVPNAPSPGSARREVFELSAGYLERARADMPKQSDAAPWRMHQNYIMDLKLLRYGRVTDEMTFGRATVGAVSDMEPAAREAA